MISVVLATFNEEKNIDRCLSSVKDWVDEIVIVDGSSTDKTVDIAKSYNAKITVTTNKPIFHINKQMALDLASYKLVLQLDADEVVDDELKEFILELNNQLQKQPNKVKESAWWIKRKNNFLGHWLKKGGQYPDPVIRLLIKGKARLPSRSVHEQMEVDGSVGWAEGHLLHFSNPTVGDYLRKMKNYTSLEADKYLLENRGLSFFFAINYIILKPIITFLLLFVRHKGFMDGFYGFLFALLSSWHFPIIFYKILTRQK